MPEKKKVARTTRRTQVKEWPKSEKELSKAEQKKVEGGAGTVFFIDVAAAKPKQ
jgi:hypothetical protein